MRAILAFSALLAPGNSLFWFTSRTSSRSYSNTEASFTYAGIADAFQSRTSRSHCMCRSNKYGLNHFRIMKLKKPSTKGLTSPSPIIPPLVLSSHHNVIDFDGDDILSMTAIALSDAIQIERSVSCEQLMKATLCRIDEINPKYNAIILLRDREELLQEARDCDRELKEQFANNNGGYSGAGADADISIQSNQSKKSNDKVHHRSKALGWLHGIPVAIKDVSNAEGLPTTMGGSPLFCSSEGLTPVDSSDPYVENMVREGAIIIGKTNAPEGGLGSNTFNEKWGKTLNPFALLPTDATAVSGNAMDHQSISAGGSSGGAAVAVTTRMLVVADGTDNMGSLRNPAGWNNIYSHRPTAGLIVPSARPQITPDDSTNEDDPPTDQTKRTSAASILPHPASTPGPMARTPLDCARLLQTMVGDTNRFDGQSLWMRKGIDSKGTMDSGIDSAPSTVRIGWLGNWGGRLPMEDGILRTCQNALERWATSSSKGDNSSNTRIVLADFQADNDEEMPLFDFDKLWEGYNTIRFASTYETYSHQFDVDHLLSTEEGRCLIKEELVWELEQGRSIDTDALHRALSVYGEYEEWLSQIFGNNRNSIVEGDEQKQNLSFDVLALPSAQVWPFPIDNRYPKVIDETPMDTYHRWMEVCVPVSFGGLPCVTVPAGFCRNLNIMGTSQQSLPIGIQLFGTKGDDLKLLHLADEYYQHSERHS